ncbi:MAG: HlyD family secretion protein [Candidatus Gastranaerophilales bacterium]|nr:HlyD family secretion protein [Candidatus Gastranaerophilales bacterium]
MDKIKKLKASRNRKEMEKKRVFIPILSVICAVLFGLGLMIYTTHYQTTDDAFVEGRLISIAPRIEGQVIHLYVDDNQEVKKGDLLLEIDPEPYQVKLNQAIASLNAAKAKLNINQKEIDRSYSSMNQSYADTRSTESRYSFAKSDYDRYAKMYGAGIVSRQDYEKSKSCLTSAGAEHKAANEKAEAAKHAHETEVAKTEELTAEIQKLEAEVAEYKLALSYTKVYAPQDGLVSARNVEEGNYVQVAQPLLSIVPKRVWVVANFKEIQLTHMEVGQPVKIKIDTYPGRTFKGVVDSIQRSTGAKSSLFPPENAVGSYVKIVQRVPVKIVFTEDYSDFNIVPGMSVVPTVKVK